MTSLFQHEATPEQLRDAGLRVPPSQEAPENSQDSASNSDDDYVPVDDDEYCEIMEDA